MTFRFIGKSLPRSEDFRLIRGLGRYTADLAPPEVYLPFAGAVVARSWAASHRATLAKVLAVHNKSMAWFSDPGNRAEAIKLIAEIDEIPAPIAEAELDGNIVKLSKDGEMQKDWMVRALDMARLIGMTDLAPVEDIYLTMFKPVPTMV